MKSQQLMTYQIAYVAASLVLGNPRKSAMKMLQSDNARQIRFGVWQRARLNARLSMALTDAWKEDAENYGVENGLVGESTRAANRAARLAFSLTVRPV